jgi:hypothetical protein
MNAFSVLKRALRPLPSNHAMDSDTVRSPLRALYGARHRER